jgi:ABC-type multidrug transport system ATPase subunit
MDSVPILNVTGLTKHYGRVAVLDDVSFELQSGSIVALLGANGAGKTTTFKCVLGMTDFGGKIEVGGKSVTRAGKEVRRLTGYLPQTPGFADGDTCAEALGFMAQLRRVPLARVDGLLEKVNLRRQRDMRIRELSGGMRQRLALAAALLSGPPLLLLDEPTANLDQQSRKDFHDLLARLRNEGTTILFSTHFVEHVAGLADRVIALNDGRVALDEPTARLCVNAGKDFTVHLNGTAPADFLGALRSVGIGEERVTRVETDLQKAIGRALESAAGKEAKE